jgi:DNA-binding XRE family transcriptional regulator|nr:MAG TPA: Helix-turn-helix XRE-family like protein [Caudoviricetes sp.]
MNGKRNAYQKAYYAANKPYFAAYRRKNSVLIAKYASGYYRENQRRYAEEQRFLQEARMRLGWSQEAVAHSVGVSQATITRLETGAQPLETFRKRDKLLEVLGVVV